MTCLLPSFTVSATRDAAYELAAGKTMGAKTSRILLACVPEAYRRLFAILSGYDLSFVKTLSDAQSALKADGFSLIMIGFYFDGSRMFELLRDVRSNRKYAEVPVVCFRGTRAADSELTFPKEVEIACKALGANVFLDLVAFSDDGSGNAAVRNRIKALLP